MELILEKELNLMINKFRNPLFNSVFEFSSRIYKLKVVPNSLQKIKTEYED